ncbi:MAG: hypothetical protein AAGA59_06630 [Actinomycetota bacterium]
MPSFRLLTTSTTALALTLATLLLAAPGVVYWLFGVDGAETADFIARRAAMLFLGVAAVAYSARHLGPSVGRLAVAAGLGVPMAGLAVLGSIELARGFAGPGILVAVVGETALALGYARIWSADRTASRTAEAGAPVHRPDGADR